jgi:hypothetical protein
MPLADSNLTTALSLRDMGVILAFWRIDYNETTE